MLRIATAALLNLGNAGVGPPIRRPGEARRWTKRHQLAGRGGLRGRGDPGRTKTKRSWTPWRDRLREREGAGPCWQVSG